MRGNLLEALPPRPWGVQPEDVPGRVSVKDRHDFVVAAGVPCEVATLLLLLPEVAGLLDRAAALLELLRPFQGRHDAERRAILQAIYGLRGTQGKGGER